MIYCFDFLDIVSYISVIFPKIKSFMIFWFFDNFQLKFMWGECGNQWNSCRIPLTVAISLDLGRKFWVPKHVYQDLMRKKSFFRFYFILGKIIFIELVLSKISLQNNKFYCMKKFTQNYSCFCCLNYVLNTICLCLDPEASSRYRISEKSSFCL